MKKLSKRFKAGLSLMLVCGMVLGNVVSANAAVDNRVDECDLVNERVESNNPKYTEPESGDADSEEMLDHAEKAEEAAKKAADEVKVLNEKLAELGVEVKVEGAVTASNSAVTVAEGAERAAATASSIATSASSSAVAALGDKEVYNTQVAADQTAIDAVKAEPVTDVAITVSEAAIEAQNQADRAKELMGIVLTGDAKDAYVKVDGEDKTVEQVVGMINDAADAAKSAYEVASSAKTSAENDLANAIKEYNKYAATSGAALYGQTEVNYLNADGSLNNDVLGLTAVELAEVEAQRARAKEFNEKKAEVLAANIDDITASVEDAQTKVETAKQAAEDAKKLADAAKAVVDEKEPVVEKEAHDGIYLIADKEAKTAKNDSEAYASKKSEFESKYNTTVEDSDTVKYNDVNIANAKNTVKNYKDTISKGDSHQNLVGISAGLFSGNSAIKTCEQIVSEGEGLIVSGFLGANSHINTADDVKNARKFIEEYYYAKDHLTAAEETVKMYEAKKPVLEAKEKAEKSQRVANEKAAEAETRKQIAENREKTLEEMQKVIDKYSDKINQTEYDQDLNAWANKFIFDNDIDGFKDFFEQLDDAMDTRSWMDDNYEASFISSLLNYLPGIQLIVGTDKEDEVMEKLIEICKNNMNEEKKLMAAAEAVLAEQKAEAASKAAAEIANSIAVASQTAVAADAAVEAAAERIETAKATVETAKAELAAAKAAVSGASLNVVDLSALKAKIVTAESKLETAEEELKVAEASKKVAEKYKAWANELVTDQATRVYNWDEDNRANNSNGGSYELKLQNNETFYVDYITLRNYIKYVIDSDMMPKTKSNEMYQKKINNNKTDEKVTVLYWEIAKDENGNRYLTGKAYDSVDKLPNADAEYLVPYQFSCYQGQYHLDGSVITTQYVEPAPVVPTTPSNYIVTNNTVSNNTPSLDLTTDETPEGSVPENTDKQPEFTMEADKDETPQGAIPNTMKLDDEETAQGATLAQTGTVPVVVFYFAAVALLLAALYFKKSFAKEN